MLTFSGPKHRYCDGITRRSFLQAGSLLMGGLSLPSLLQAEQRSGTRSHKAVIMVYLSGGLSHHDSFDMKPDAPAEIRGEFKPIATKVPGVQICELLPHLAGMMDQIAVVRSIVGLRDEHSSFQTLTGYRMNQTQREGKPNACSVISRILGPTSPVIPAYVDLFPTMQHKPYNIPGPGWIGPAYAGARVDSDKLALLRLNGLTQDQFQGRQQLLARMDRLQRTLQSDSLSRMDTSYRQAFEVLTSSRLVEAMDLEKESPAVRARYDRGSPKHQGDGAPLWNEQLLMARRLVEAGVRCVTVAYGFWDTHGGNFKRLRKNLPLFDTGISALVEDLKQRGMLQDVQVVVWGEFGRTPKINKDAGRDHWAPVNTVLLAGGGTPGGQALGATDKIGAHVIEKPVHYRNILATVYRNLGIDPHTAIKDVLGRAIAILPEETVPVLELCS
jgi:Protein of unknown function (DUF1501)